MKYVSLGSVILLCSVVSASGADALRGELNARRDAFIAAIADQGFHCPFAAPAIIIENTPGYGNYVGKNNTIVIASWNDITPQQRRQFSDMASTPGHPSTGRRMFENGTHKWVFIHELGHWWQHCAGKDQTDSYALEMGANRIATAYWRSADPKQMAIFADGFKGLAKSLPNPVPHGADKRAYFDERYEALGRDPTAYTWYQSGMVANAYDERPVPTLRATLAQPTYPPR